MITAGIDAGIRFLKVAIVSDGKLIGSSTVFLGSESPLAVFQQALDEAVKRAAISREDIERIAATGTGANELPFKQERESFCLASGVHWIIPEVNVVLDIGAMKAIAIRIKEGKPWQVATNDKCAAGTGMFLEMISELLGIKFDEMGELSLQSKENVEVSSTCSVFAESEIISLLNQKKRVEDILPAVLRALARQMHSLVLRANGNGTIAITGGGAQCAGLVAAIKEILKATIIVPERPGIVGATGAALIAAD